MSDLHEIQKIYSAEFRRYFGIVSVQCQLVTPEVAQGWLEKSKWKNRPSSKNLIQRYCRSILGGEWRVNGETIVFDDSGNLLDGQHRLKAIVATGITIPMLIIRDIDKDAFKTLNQGKLRSAADTLATLDKHKAGVLATALSWLNRYMRDCMEIHIPKPTNMEVLELLAEVPEIENSVRWVCEVKALKHLSLGLFSFLHHVCVGRHPEHEPFFYQILTNTSLEPDKPVTLLSKRLTDLAANKRRQSNPQLETAALVIKAWNATVEGTCPRVLRWNPPEDFPTIL